MCLLTACNAFCISAFGCAKLYGSIVYVLRAKPVKPLLVPFEDVERIAQKFLKARVYFRYVDSHIGAFFLIAIFIRQPGVITVGTVTTVIPQPSTDFVDRK